MSDQTAHPSNIMTLPSLGADMDFGSVIEWRVGPGDTVDRGDVIAVVETEKADIDVEIWQAGVVAELLLDVGHEVPVGTPMLRLTADAAAVAADAPAEAPVEPAEAAVEPAAPAEAAVVSPDDRPAPTPAVAVSERADVVPASPLARVRAESLGVDLRRVNGSGPDGAVLVADVDAFATGGASAPSAGDRTDAPTPPVVPPASPPSTADRAAKRALSMRHAIAERMAMANRDIPHYHLDLDVDLGPMFEALEHHNATRPVGERVLPAAVFLEAAAKAAAAHPECNGSWVDQGFVGATSVDLGVAISLRRGGLVTPVITAADSCSTTEIMTRLKELVTAARSGALKSSWMVDASLTVTNLGDHGADRVHGVIFPPQVALVGFGRVQTRPWVVDGAVLARPVVTVSLTADHRATDGLVGSRFLSTIAKRLEDSEIT